MRLIFTTLFLFLSLSIYSQKTDTLRQIWYPISPEIAMDAIQNWYGALDDKMDWKNATSYSFPIDKDKADIKQELPYGQYIKVIPEKGDIAAYWETHHKTSIEILNDGKKNWLIIADAKGERIQAEWLRCKGREIKFNQEKKAYQLPKIKKDTEVFYKYENQLSYFDIWGNEDDDDYYYDNGWDKFKSKTWFGRNFINRPKYFFVRTWKNIFRKKNKDENYQIKRLRDYTSGYRGYIALNQAKFQHYDTLKAKGYFLNYKSEKPYIGKVKIIIGKNKGYNSLDTLYTTTLPLHSKGQYAFDFVIGDSLTLDQNHKIIFKFGEEKNARQWIKKFYVEEYELDEVEYKFSSTQKEYKKGEAIILKASAKYTNGQNVPNVKIELIAKVTRIKKFLADSLLVPDTIWRHQQDLHFSEETQIILPDSILPEAELNVEIEARLSTLDGELQNEYTNVIVNTDALLDNENKLNINNENGSIIITSKGEFKNKSATLITETNNGKIYEKINLPYKEKINPFVESYTVSLGKEEVQLHTKDTSPSIFVSGNNGKDSISIVIKNKYQIPIEYTLYHGTHIISQEMTIDSIQTIKRKTKDEKAWTIKYNYVWAGEAKTGTEIFHKAVNRLQIDVKQPETAEPGEEIEVEITVKDYEGNPLQGVDLTAASMSAKFQNNFSQSYKMPGIYSPRYKNIKSKKTPEFSQGYSKYKIGKIEHKKYWSTKLQFDKSEEYKMRFPENGIYQKYIPLPDEIGSEPQIMVFVVNDGNIRYTYSIHLDRVPRYYHDAPAGGYTLIDNGWVRDVRIRLNNAIIEIEKVDLKYKNKLILIIDEEYAEQKKINNVTYKKVKPYWTTKELNERKNTLIAINNNYNNNKYFYEKSKRVFSITSNRDKKVHLIGPFAYKANINVTHQNEFRKWIPFEPGFIYDITSSRERLYEHDVNSNLVKKELTEKWFKNAYVPQFAMAEKLVKNKSWTDPFSHRYNEYEYTPSNNKLTIKYNGPKPLFIILNPTEEERSYIYKSETQHFHNINAGKYEIIYVFEWGYHAEFIDVKNNHSSYLKIDNTQGELSQKDFKLKIQKALGENYDWENSIFKKRQQELLGNKDIWKIRPDKSSYEIEYSQIVYNPDNININCNTVTRKIGGIITSEDEPDGIIGANVVVVGCEREVGTVTDYDGTFELDIPRDALYLEISYTGYETQVIEAKPYISVILMPGAILSEVVVTGYSTTKRSALSSSVMVIGNDDLEEIPLGDIQGLLQGKSTGVQVSAANGRHGSAAYVRLRGTGSANAGNEPLYIIDGVLVSSAVMTNIDPNNITDITVLKDDEATAIYGSSAVNGVIIVTTKPGTIIPTESEATLQGFQIRENFSDYAFWQPYLITDENGKARFRSKLPDDITGWKTYVLCLHRKSQGGIGFAQTASYKKLMASLSVPRFAIEGDSLNIIGEAVNYSPDSLNIQTQFSINGNTLPNRDTGIKNTVSDILPIAIEEGQDSLHIQYELRTTQYGDGERRSIPVFPRGTSEHKGEFSILRGDSSFTFQALPDIPVNISIQKSRMDVLLESVDYLKNYRYGCAEQTSSKLIALLLEKDIRKQLNQTFEYEKDIQKNIIRLQDMQNDDGSWGWWKGNDGIPWISLYVAEALQMAKLAGYNSKSYEPSMDYLAQHQHIGKNAHRLKAMSLLLTDSTNIDTSQFSHFDSLELSTEEYLLFTRVKQQVGMDVNWDSLQNYFSSSTYGGLYISSSSSYWYYRNSDHTLLAYDIALAANKVHLLDKMDLHFLHKRRNRRWYNTIQTAQILKRLLPRSKGNSLEGKLFLNGNEIKEFPFQTTLPAEEIKFSHQGTAPHFISASQEIWDRNPAAKRDVFDVESQFLQEGKPVDILQKSTATQLSITVHAKQSADYVMLEIPIPAGCSYGQKTQSYYGKENHREYHKEKVVIFCTSLNKGKHTFIVNLEPRYTGKYILNPTKVEEMYAPIIFGRNEMKNKEISR